jgi:hypothetical protein
MKLRIATIAILSLTGLVWADDLDDAYTALKDAQTANSADDILKWAPEVSKLSRAEAAKTKPGDMTEEAWKARVDFAKQADTLSEYALSAGAMQGGLDGAKAVSLVDALLAQNAKSQYLGQVAGLYIASLEKSGGAAKSLDGANKILNASPNNEDALFSVMNGSYGKANDRAEAMAGRLINVMRAKAKPEGVAEADWDRKKNTMLGYAYYYAGLIPGTSSRPSYTDCDRNLRGGMSYIRAAGLSGTALFYLGLCNYQISKLTNDKGKLTEALQFTDQAVAAGGQMAGQAATNAAVMRRELGGSAAATKPAAAKPAAKGKAK